MMFGSSLRSVSWGNRISLGFVVALSGVVSKVSYCSRILMVTLLFKSQQVRRVSSMLPVHVTLCD